MRRAIIILLLGATLAWCFSQFSTAGVGVALNIGTGAAPANWETVGFNDSSWTATVAGITGVAPAITGANWISDLSSVEPSNTKVLFRIPFTLTSTSSLTLKIGGDNFVTACFINGNAISVSAGNFVVTTVAVPAGDLVIGSNVLAVQVLNDALGASPLSLAFSLTQPTSGPSFAIIY